MYRLRSFFVIALGPAWFAGCGTGDVVAPAAADPAVLSFDLPTDAPADISGVWSLSRVLQVTAPDWVAQLVFGIEPEGPVTLFRCASSGSLTLSQADGGFTGTAEWTANLCETNGGQVFSAGSPPIAIDGHISGRSLHFDWTEAGMLSCPHRAVSTQIVDGTAVHLSGTGRCIVPGHPLSPVPLDPPPAGTSKVLVWEAVRP